MLTESSHSEMLSGSGIQNVKSLAKAAKIPSITHRRHGSFSSENESVSIHAILDNIGQYNVRKRSFPQKSLDKYEDEEDNRQIGGITDEVVNLSVLKANKKTTPKPLVSFLTRKQAQILCTLLPDEIIHKSNPLKKEVKYFIGVLLYADVCGFTSVCEKYSNTGKGGTYRLSAILNAYIGAMVEVIYCHGGDVLKFSGDSFLAFWKIGKNDTIYNIVHKVVKCGLHIQTTLGSYKTDVGVCLQVKLAISAGNLTFAVIGDDISRHYVCVGTPVQDVKSAERSCSSGEIVLSPSAWMHCNSKDYDYSLKDEFHIKIHGILVDQSKNRDQLMLKSSMTEDIKVKGPTKDVRFTRKNQSRGNKVQNETDSLSTDIMRKSVEDLVLFNLGPMLRPFLIPPVVQQVDADQPLEFLSEMRQVTTMFINIIPQALSSHKLVSMVDDAFCIVGRLMQKYGGCVNKVTMFDKDTAILCVFGLRGYKHDLGCQIPLVCALKAQHDLAALTLARHVSIGLTTGMAYCGVIGHPLRREYTVIGGTVNAAARMMCVFPKKVTCDLATFQRSKLPVENFILQEPRELRGFDNLVPIYEYTKCHRSDPGSFCRLPLLGREEEMKTFFATIEDISKLQLQHGGLLIRGEPRIGKTRLLEEFIIEAKKINFTTVHVSLDPFHATTPYSAAYLVIEYFLGLKENSSMREREERLFDALGKERNETLCYLNDILQVQFPYNLEFLGSSIQKRQEKSLVVFQDILKMGPGELLISVDDAQFMDSESWQLLCPIMYHDRALLLMAVTEDEPLSATTSAILAHELLLHMKLNGIKSEFIVPLACQILQVEAVSLVINDLLKSRSKGNPGWCESFLLALRQNGGLRKIMANYRDAGAMQLIVADNKFIVGPKPELEEAGNEFGSFEPTGKSNISACVIPANFNINKQILPNNLDAIILKTFDSLPPYEQLLLKCAAVLGVRFSRKLLVAILPKPVLREIAFAVVHLFELRILVCSGKESEHSAVRLSPSNKPSVVGLNTQIECYCRTQENSEKMFYDCKDLPNYAFCTELLFSLPAVCDTIYELMLEDQKVKLHTRAVEFLEGQTLRCGACGGGGFAINPCLRLDGYELTLKRSSAVTTQPAVVDDSPEIELPLPSQSPSDQLILTRMTESKINYIMKRDSESLTTIPAKDVHYSQGQYKSLNITSKTTMHKNNNSVEILGTQTRRRSSFLTRIFAREPKKKKRLSLDSISAGFTDADFRHCECPLVLSSVYSQIIKHCSAAGLVMKHIRFLIDYGAASNLLGKNMLAIQLLLEARDLALKNTSSMQVGNPSRHMTNLKLGKIYSLIGKSYLDMGCCKKSKKYLFMALEKYGFPFHQRNPRIQVQFHGIKQYFQQLFSDVFMSKEPMSNSMLHEEVTVSMGLLCNVFMVERDWELAKLAALRCLNLAQRSSSSLPNLCAAYSNLMDVCHYYGEHDNCRRLEEFSLRNCQDNYQILVAEDLLALGRLYCATFMSRLQRGEISSAIKIGFRILQISSRVYASHVKLFVLPLLVQALVMSGRLSEAVDLLRELEFCAGRDQDQSSTAWFHVLCLDLLLESGVGVESSSSALEFCRAMTRDAFIIRDTDAKKRLVVASWQWHVRRGEWKAADEWSKLADKYLYEVIDTSFSGLVTALKLLECLLVTMVTLVSKREPAQVEVYRHSLVEPLLAKLRVQSMCTKVTYPRYLHLKAYSSMTKRHKSRALQFLAQAKKLSVVHGNVLEEAWIDHSIAVWSGQLNKLDQDYWTTHSGSKANVDCHHVMLQDWSKMMFTLPLESR